MELAGRTAIITGANQGLGKAIATHFVRAGASVLLAARNNDLLKLVEAELRELATLPGQVIASARADVACEADCAALATRARELFPGLTALVNNAGVYGPLGSLEEIDWEQWVEAIQINLLGTVYLTRAILPWMKQQRYGKVISLSGGGATAPLPRFSAYAASKAALVRFCETLAEECKGDGIDVNAIAPGALNTRLLDEVLAAGPDRVGRGFYEKSLKQRDNGGTSLDKGAELAVFLASAASDGITGRLISAVWDDWRGLEQRKQVLAGSDVFTLRRIVPQDRGLAC